MNDKELANIIDKIIPNIILKNKPYNISWGKTLTLNLNGVEYQYLTYNSGGKGGKIGKLYKYIEDESANICTLNLRNKEVEYSYVKRLISSKWLELVADINQNEWSKMFDDLEQIKKRTYENLPIVMNLVIDKIKTGKTPLSDSCDSKIYDVIAGTNYTYFLVDTDLNIIDYLCIRWDDTKDKKSYSSLPNFLQPYANILTDGRIGISLTHSGDIIVYKENGMIMSIRKGNWTVYDDSLVKNLYRDIINASNYGVVCNLFDICWDLSYRRHGALIIVVSDDSYKKHIVNKESILNDISAKGFRKELKTAFERVSLKITGEIKGRSLFLELASVDGAIVIDSTDGTIKAFGSIIETASSISDTSGARTTAAKSAVTYNKMIPIKISSDGDITLYRYELDRTSGEEVILEYKFF